MKKICMAALLVGALPLTAFADNTGPGCGLGTEIFKGKSGLVSNVLASTTNGLFGNQTFGMSFGTLGCDAEKMVSNDFQREVFVASNADSLARDVARGQGDYLASLAELMGVKNQHKAQFFSVAQNNYDVIFSDNIANAQDVLARLDSSMMNDAVLAQYVN